MRVIINRLKERARRLWCDLEKWLKEQRASSNKAEQKRNEESEKPSSDLTTLRDCSLSTNDNTDKPKATKEDEPTRHGGQRNAEHTPPKPSTNEKELPSFRPQLMCRKKGGAWEVILSASDECPITRVHLGDQDLEMTNQECPIDSLEENLFACSENGDEREVALFNGEPLIFKLQKNRQNNGRKIPKITHGHFIVIAPAEWTRVSGKRDMGKGEPCKDEKFMAHFFDRDKNDSHEEIGGFEGQPPLPVGLSIEWDGEHIFDDSDEDTMFVGNAPKHKWLSGVEWARDGEERKGGWKGENFKMKEIKTLAEVLNGREGRFFLRIYDADGAMLDSEPFRYMSQLKEIRVDGKPYTAATALAPKSAGYLPTEVQIIARDGSRLNSKPSSEPYHVKLAGDVIKVPPHHKADRIVCALETKTSDVQIVLQLPRIWWRLESDGDDAGEWGDKPITMTREEFRALARKDIEISILSKRCKLVHAGFNDKRDKQYSRKEADECIQIPLYEFDDRLSVEPESHAPLQFKVEWMGKVTTIIEFDSLPNKSEPKPPPKIKIPENKETDDDSPRGAGRVKPSSRPRSVPFTGKREGMIVWFYYNTWLTCEQIADFVGMPVPDIQVIGKTQVHIRAENPVEDLHLLTQEEIERCEGEPDARLRLKKISH